MQFEVPQFIEVEDKIFGPLTWRQFLYLGGGVGMALVIFFTLPLALFIFFGIPLALLAGALSFYPVNNRPFSYFLEAIFNYLSNKRLYLWRQQANIIHRSELRTEFNTQPTPNYVTPPTIKHPKQNITSLARKLELQALQKSE